jgi:hypothetical protein
MAGIDLERHLKPLVAGGLALLLLGTAWLYSLHQQRLTQLDRQISAARSELTELGQNLQEYHQLENQLRRMRPPGNTGNSNLITTVENAAERVGARSQLIYVRPQPDKTRDDLIEEGVEIKLEKMQLHQLVELLFQFDKSGPQLNVSQLRVRTRFDNPEQLDTSIILSQLKEKR